MKGGGKVPVGDVARVGCSWLELNGREGGVSPRDVVEACLEEARSTWRCSRTGGVWARRDEIAPILVASYAGSVPDSATAERRAVQDIA
eukprot:3931539-Rhodomonas_salina.2